MAEYRKLSRNGRPLDKKKKGKEKKMNLHVYTFQSDINPDNYSQYMSHTSVAK